MFIFLIISILIAIFFGFFTRFGYYETGPFLFTVALLIGIFHKDLCFVGFAFKFVSEIHAILFLLIFLPLLTFKWIFAANTKLIKNSLGQILILAIAGFIITFFLQSGTMIYINGYEEIFGWKVVFIPIAVIAATDSGPAVNTLKNSNSKLQVQTLLEGESLVNNMVSAMFFYTVIDMFKAATYSAEDFAVKFLIVTFGAIGIGLITALIFTPFIKRLKNPYLIAGFTFFVQYLAFFISDMPMFGFAVPGYLALFASGFYMSINLKPHLSPKCLSTLYSVWDFTGFVSGSLCFIITGTFFGVYLGDNIFLAEAGVFNASLHLTWNDFGMAFVFMIFTLLFRLATVFILWPFLLCAGPKISWKECLIISFCGFRGVVGVSIILFVAWNPDFNRKFGHVSLLFITVLIFISQIFKAFLLKPLIKCLSYNQFEVVQKEVFGEVKKKFYKDIFQKIKAIEKNIEISYDINWEIIYEIFGLDAHEINFQDVKNEKVNLLLDYDSQNSSMLNLLEDHDYFESKYEKDAEYDISDVYNTQDLKTSSPFPTFENNDKMNFIDYDKSNAFAGNLIIF